MENFKSRIYMLLFVSFILVFNLLNMGLLYSDIEIPSIIKIGLNYGVNSANNFLLKSNTKLCANVTSAGRKVELANIKAFESVIIRKDAYYNIIDSKVTQISYTKAAQYQGDLIGPYHIQIGGTYENEAKAQEVVNQLKPIIRDTFIVYEDGFKVWSCLYLDEYDCTQQIQNLQKEFPEFEYKIIYPDRKRIQIIDPLSGTVLYILNGENDIEIYSVVANDNNTGLIEYNKIKYRGIITLKQTNGSDILVVNTLPFEEYLYGVVPSEIPYTWPQEALKAQAVAARNYAILNINKHRSQGFNLCSGQDCQAYKGYTQENIRTTEAVKQTSGKLLYFENKLVQTYYHSSSGGYTENSENVWNSYIPYIRAVEDKYGLGSPHDNWSKQFDKEYIKAKLIEAKLDVGDILDIVPLEISQYGRVTKLEIRGTKENKVLEKERIRLVLGTSAIKSIWYTLETDADMYIRDNISGLSTRKRAVGLYVMSKNGKEILLGSSNKIFIKSSSNITSINAIPKNYTFKGKGWGHGLGMSQYGAKGMAEAGFDYKQILEYYYKGAKVQ